MSKYSAVLNISMQSSPDNLPEAIDRIVKRFQRLSDPKQRYEQLILYGKKLEAFPDKLKTPENKVQGCVSQVFVVAKLDENERVVFSGDSDALISKGFLGLLSICMSGLTQKEIEHLSPDFIKDTGLVASLTPSRANGFYNVFKKMQQQAIEIELPSVR
jgi:cysteine desulfuration protein SufE|nr:SufE family protein [Pseudanabaena cinerea]